MRPYESLRPVVQVLLLILFSIILGTIGSGGSMLVISSLFDVPFSDMEAWMLNATEPAAIEAMKWMNNIAQVFMFALPPLLMMYLAGRRSMNGFMLNDTGWMVIMIPFLVIASDGPIMVSSWINEWLIPQGGALEAAFRPSEDAASKIQLAMLSPDTVWQLVVTFLSVGIIPAFCEEFFFRGALQPLLAKATRNIHAAIWTSAFFFSLIHMQMYGFLPRMLLGALLGYLVVWSGSLWTSILAHMFNNCLAIILVIWFPADADAGETEGASLTSAVVMSFITSAMLIYVFVRNSRWSWYRSEYLGIENPDGDAQYVKEGEDSDQNPA